jgi:tetratricopeptide (TPR) repeat protein
MLDGLSGLAWRWLGGLGLTGLFISYLTWRYQLAYGQALRFLRARWNKWRRLPTVNPLPDRVLVVLCCLDGDDIKETNLRTLARAMRDPSLKLQLVLDFRRVVVRDTDQTAALLAARQRANGIARDYRAPVVVWGEVTEAQKGLALHFQGAGSSISRELKIDRGIVEAAVREPLDSILAAVAGAAVLEAAATARDDVSMLVNNRGQFIADRLHGPAERIERALSEPGLAMDDARRGALLFALANARLAIGEQGGDEQALRDAVAHHRLALDHFDRNRVPLDWATTQNNLGSALARLGERGDDAALRDAVTAFRAALEERRRDRVPLDWAMTQNNLGLALVRLGERGDDAALHNAVTAFRAALEERRRDRVPLQWAMTQNNLGNALARLGERGDDAALHDAVTAYRAALEELRRDRVPLQWAMTQNNLGNALETLGERNDDAALLGAVAAYRAALEVFESLNAPAYVAGTRQNLTHAEALLRSRGLEPPT